VFVTFLLWKPAAQNRKVVKYLAEQEKSQLWEPISQNPIRQILDNLFKILSKQSIDVYKLFAGRNAEVYEIWSFCIPPGNDFDSFFPIGKVKWGIPWFAERERYPTVYGFCQYMFMDLIMHNKILLKDKVRSLRFKPIWAHSYFKWHRHVKKSVNFTFCFLFSSQNILKK